MENLSSHNYGGADIQKEMCPDLNVVPDNLDLPDGGFSLPDYEGEVRSSVLKNPIDCKYGYIEENLVTMEDDTQYDVLVCTPNEQRSDTMIATTTAWWTHPKLEHNRKTIRSALWLGYPIAMIGAPKGFNASDVSLSKATYDMHRILDAEISDLDVNPRSAIILGASRAAMSGMGMSIEKYARGREIPYADVTAPCVPRPFNASEWRKVIGQLGREALSIGSTAADYGKRGQLLQYAKSIVPDDPSHVYNALRIFPGLIMGEAGKLADEASDSTAIHIDEFSEDYWALTPEWSEKFKNRDNVVITAKLGTHIGGIASVKTRRDINARLETLAEIRGFDGAFEDVDFKNEVLPIQAVHKTKNTYRLPTIPGIPFMRKAV